MFYCLFFYKILPSYVFTVTVIVTLYSDFANHNHIILTSSTNIIIPELTINFIVLAMHMVEPAPYPNILPYLVFYDSLRVPIAWCLRV